MGPDGAMRVKHREYLSNVSKTVDEVTGEPLILGKAINPGDSATFPWLSQVAGRFEKYKVHSLSFGYQNFCSRFNTGTVCLMIDYDPSDSAPSNKGHMLNSYGAKRSAVYNNLSCPMDTSKIRKDLIVRQTDRGTFAGGDLKLHDAGTLYFLLSDSDVVGDAGELWVEYDITLSIPAFRDTQPQFLRVTDPGQTVSQESNVAWNHVLGEGTNGRVHEHPSTSLAYTTREAIKASGYTGQGGSEIVFNEPFAGQMTVRVGDTDDVYAPTIVATNDEESFSPWKAFGKIANITTHVIQGLTGSETEGVYAVINCIAEAGESFVIETLAGAANWAGDVLFELLPMIEEAAPLLLLGARDAKAEKARTLGLAPKSASIQQLKEAYEAWAHSTRGHIVDGLINCQVSVESASLVQRRMLPKSA